MHFDRRWTRAYTGDAAISMSSVLDLLGFAATERSGDQLRGPCPLHGSSSSTSRSFSVNPRKNSYRCFRCGRSGIYDAALDLCQRLNVPVPTRKPEPHGRTNAGESEKRNP
jgi:DNA primase